MFINYTEIFVTDSKKSPYFELPQEILKYVVADVNMISSILFKLNNICYNYVDVR